MSDLFLGIDCSTQSLTGLIINFHKKEVIYREQIIYEKDLPQYKTKNGVIFFDNERVVHSYPLMWVDALNLLFNNLIQKEFAIYNIKAISGSGQQHGTVYLNRKFKSILSSLNPIELISEQIREAFTRETSPIWMDSSTTEQCKQIREHLGGLKNTILLTGSNTFERFSGPQIRKFFQEDYEKYKHTDIIHLVSSFMASLLIGKNAPIDHGDGAGMNLMNINSKSWDEKALNATAPNLKDKLPSLVPSNKVIGNISNYFIEKYGFNSNTKIIAWSGDNQNSLIGVGLTEKGKVAISLGTSDTYFGYLKNLYLDLKGEGHVFGAPTGDYMSLICYKNGSLARETIKEMYNLDWRTFSNILEDTPPGNYGKIMLAYFHPEIVPSVLEPGIYRFGFDESDVNGNVRGIIESKFLSMKVHANWIEEKPNIILATGGASTNKEILQVAANIFNSKIKKAQITDSAALGAAFRSAKSYYDLKGEKKGWNEITNDFLKLQESEIIHPNEIYVDLYREMAALYKMYEDFILNNGQDPEFSRQEFIKKYFS
ncbi:MAG: xylulokinase [Promethearchaeota archaeon]